MVASGAAFGPSCSAQSGGTSIAQERVRRTEPARRLPQTSRGKAGERVQTLVGGAGEVLARHLRGARVRLGERCLPPLQDPGGLCTVLVERDEERRMGEGDHALTRPRARITAPAPFSPSLSSRGRSAGEKHRSIHRTVRLCPRGSVRGSLVIYDKTRQLFRVWAYLGALVLCLVTEGRAQDGCSIAMTSASPSPSAGQNDCIRICFAVVRKRSSRSSNAPSPPGMLSRLRSRRPPGGFVS